MKRFFALAFGLLLAVPVCFASCTDESISEEDTVQAIHATAGTAEDSKITADTTEPTGETTEPVTETTSDANEGWTPLY